MQSLPDRQHNWRGCHIMLTQRQVMSDIRVVGVSAPVVVFFWLYWSRFLPTWTWSDSARGSKRHDVSVGLHLIGNSRVGPVSVVVQQFHSSWGYMCTKSTYWTETPMSLSTWHELRSDLIMTCTCTRQAFNQNKRFWHAQTCLIFRKQKKNQLCMIMVRSI